MCAYSSIFAFSFVFFFSFRCSLQAYFGSVFPFSCSDPRSRKVDMAAYCKMATTAKKDKKKKKNKKKKKEFPIW